MSLVYKVIELVDDGHFESEYDAMCKGAEVQQKTHKFLPQKLLYLPQIAFSPGQIVLLGNLTFKMSAFVI